MKIKVCGMKYYQNISDLTSLDIDMMGMILYPKSARYVGNISEYEVSKIHYSLSARNIKKVGVFVNSNSKDILHTIKEFKLDYVQLHGNETPDFCRELKQQVNLIKAFSISEEADFEQTNLYEGICSYFLFDTKTSLYGGSGQKFDWTILKAYQGQTPFLLSGGISANDAKDIKCIEHPLFSGIDLNSRFEVEPAMKDINLLTAFLKELQS